MFWHYSGGGVVLTDRLLMSITRFLASKFLRELDVARLL